jgi:hypothetical protein
MKISQLEARRLRRRVRELEAEQQAQRCTWKLEWPSAKIIRRYAVDDITWTAINTARALNHAVVVVPDSGNQLAFFATEL